MKAVITLLFVCAIVFIVGHTFQNAGDLLIEILLPKELEKVKPAADLIVQPLDSAIKFSSAISQAISSIINTIFALFTFEIVTFISELLTFFISVLAAIFHIIAFVVSFIVAILAIIIGIALSGTVFLGGLFA